MLSHNGGDFVEKLYLIIVMVKITKIKKSMLQKLVWSIRHFDKYSLHEYKVFKKLIVC